LLSLAPTVVAAVVFSGRVLSPVNVAGFQLAAATTVGASESKKAARTARMPSLVRDVRGGVNTYDRPRVPCPGGAIFV
jgi:hypothetical protein